MFLYFSWDQNWKRKKKINNQLSFIVDLFLRELSRSKDLRSARSFEIWNFNSLLSLWANYIISKIKAIIKWIFLFKYKCGWLECSYFLTPNYELFSSHSEWMCFNGDLISKTNMHSLYVESRIKIKWFKLD